MHLSQVCVHAKDTVFLNMYLGVLDRNVVVPLVMVFQTSSPYSQHCHLAMSRDILEPWLAGATGTYGVEARDEAVYAAMCRTAPHSTELSCPECS